MAAAPDRVLAAVRSIPHPRQEPTMTAPHPSPAGLSPLLDQLDEARAKGTPGEWGAGNGTDLVTGLEQTGPGSYRYTYEIGRVSEERWDDWEEQPENPATAEADAALIVAAVNALPTLIRLAREREALRQAVETVAAWCEEQAASRSHFAKVDPAYRNTVIPYEATAERIRATLTAALTPGADTAGATA